MTHHHSFLHQLLADMLTLQAMNGLMDITRRVARILGPGMAGILLAAAIFLATGMAGLVRFGIR